MKLKITPKKQVIILFGPPGAGKGTQAGLLSEKLNLYYFETSKVLEEKFKEAEGLSDDSSERFIEIKGVRYDVLNEKKIWGKGVLCTPPFVAHLVKEKIKKLFSEGNNLILAGSPRTLPEGRELTPFLADLYGKENIKIISIELSPEQTVFRNSHRKICELMRHPMIYSKENECLTLCPLDGSKLMRREGLDDPETIKVRLNEYKERTWPLIEYFKKEGLDIKTVKGEQPVADVFKDILAQLP